MASKVSSGAARKIDGGGVDSAHIPEPKGLSYAPDLVGLDKPGHGPTEQVVGSEAEDIGRVGADPDDREVRPSKRQEHAVRLDGAGGVDRLPAAVDQVGVTASEFRVSHGPYSPSNNQRSSAVSVSIDRVMTSPASSSRQWDSRAPRNSFHFAPTSLP